MSYGIKETKEVVEFGFKIGEAFKEAAADKKFEISDLVLFVTPLLSAESAFSGISQVPAEMKDLTDEERDELKNYFKENFDLEDDKLEEKIEAGFETALSILKLVTLF